MEKQCGQKGVGGLDTATQIEINDLLLNDDLADEVVAEMLRQQNGFTDEQAQARSRYLFLAGI
jgi:hypothetical protein